MSLINEQAPESVAYNALVETGKQSFASDFAALQHYKAEDEAHTKLLEVLREAAEIALHWQRKVTWEQHESADQNALDTVYEAGVSLESDAGRLIYNRVYVASLKLL